VPTALSYEPCEEVTARANSLALARYRTNDYSVPTAYGNGHVLVKDHVHRVEIVDRLRQRGITSYPRSYGRESAIYDPVHYLALLEQKSRALDQPAPLSGFQTGLLRGASVGSSLNQLLR
jgi:hypothetical protein